MSTLKHDIVDLRRSIVRNHAELQALTRLLDFNEKAIAIVECASAKDEPMGTAARALLALLDKEAP